MAAGVHLVELPLAHLFLVAGGTVALWVGALRLLKVLSERESRAPGESVPDYSIPFVDSQAHGDSLFHRWDPRIKIVALLGFIFCTAFLHQLPWAALSFLISACAVIAARIPFLYPLRRLMAMSGFLCMFLVVMPVSVPEKSGDTLLVFQHLPWISFNVRGFLLALLICVKAGAIALLVEPLLATSPFSHTVQALAALRVPQIVCQMILLSYRYIFVFQRESGRMAKGMRARGFRKRTDVDTLKNIGNFLGMLLVRSFERTQRVYEAMISRGYNGTLPGRVRFVASRRDWLKGAFWLVAGVALLIGDRLFTMPRGPWF